VRCCSYAHGVIGFLRFVGIANAAVWFGAAIFFTLGVGPGIFSEDIQKLFGDAAFPYYAGGVALVLIKRYFVLQYLCGMIALVHLLAEWLYLGRAPSRFTLGLVILLVILALAGGIWARPRMTALRQTMYSAPTQAQREEAKNTFRTWHGLFQTVNLFMIIGQGVYLMRVTRPQDTGRYGGLLTKFRS
jgi:Domain of unknown function (DUF4149)